MNPNPSRFVCWNLDSSVQNRTVGQAKKGPVSNDQLGDHCRNACKTDILGLESSFWCLVGNDLIWSILYIIIYYYIITMNNNPIPPFPTKHQWVIDRGQVQNPAVRSWLLVVVLLAPGRPHWKKTPEYSPCATWVPPVNWEWPLVFLFGSLIWPIDILVISCYFCIRQLLIHSSSPRHGAELSVSDGMPATLSFFLRRGKGRSTWLSPAKTTWVAWNMVKPDDENLAIWWQ